MTQSDTKISPEANAIIRKHALASLTSGILPIPLVDVAILGGIQLRMVRRLAGHYEVEFSEQRARAVIGMLVSFTVASTAGSVLRHFVTPAARLLTGLGYMTTNAAVTYGLGRVLGKHFASGGTVWTFDPERAKEAFQEEVEQGQKVVEESYAGVKP